MIDLSPKPEARSCVANDYLFAMMSTKSKPTWRHSTWNGEDYVICTVSEPLKKLPMFKPGKWSLATRSRISLYGRDAKSMKNFTLHVDHADQCDSLDRSWFGEMWFPVEKDVYQVQAAISQDLIPDPADLGLEHASCPGCMEEAGSKVAHRRKKGDRQLRVLHCDLATFEASADGNKYCLVAAVTIEVDKESKLLLIFVPMPASFSHQRSSTSLSRLQPTSNHRL